MIVHRAENNAENGGTKKTFRQQFSKDKKPRPDDFEYIPYLAWEWAKERSWPQLYYLCCADQRQIGERLYVCRVAAWQCRCRLSVVE